MTIKISFTKKTGNKSSSNLVLFVDEKFNTKSLKNYISSNEFSYINDLLKTSDLKKNIFVVFADYDKIEHFMHAHLCSK